MPAIGQTLTQEAGPLPVWAWLGLGTVGLAAYLYVRKQKKAAAAAQQAAAQSQGLSSTTTVPISNLSTQAQPMPIQMGDTFVSLNGVGGNQPAPTNPVATSTPPSDTLTGVSAPTPSPAVNVAGT